MLYEKINYSDDFPVKITVAAITEYPAHYHQDIELVYVLRGRIRLKNGYCSYLLKEGDIFTNSGHEVHSLTAVDEDNAVAVIQISNRFFTRYFPHLTRNCFRTYVDRDPGFHLDSLRQMLLNILLDYLRKSFNYKNQCVFMMIDVIEYLNRYFNLFYFENQVVVNFKEENPVISRRVSRIINYIYENYSSKITLEVLAGREHLNTFYLSHLIKDHIGISFQELLCFARVEMSEVPLLQTDKKISAVAKEVGFSTTAYYEKYFAKWFGCSPAEHRRQLKSKTLSSLNPPRIRILAEVDAIHLIRDCLSEISGQQVSALAVSREQSSIVVDADKPPVLTVDHLLEISVTGEDIRIMGAMLLPALKRLGPSKVCLVAAEKEDAAFFKSEEAALFIERLEKAGFTVQSVSESRLDAAPSFGFDSIAAVFHMLKEYFLSERPVRCRLRDQGDPSVTLKGSLSCFTSDMIPKPSYYACRMLSLLKGELLCWHKNYAVLRTGKGRRPSFVLLVQNYNSEIERLCLRSCSVHEVHDVCSGFIDEYSPDFVLPLAPGRYSVMKFALGEDNNIFYHMAQLGFPRKIPLEEDWLEFLCTGPQAQAYKETAASGGLNISFRLRGPSVQLALVQPEA